MLICKTCRSFQVSYRRRGGTSSILASCFGSPVFRASLVTESYKLELFMFSLILQIKGRVST